MIEPKHDFLEVELAQNHDERLKPKIMSLGVHKMCKCVLVT